MKYLIFHLLMLPLFSFSQEKDDNQITINPSDTVGLYNKVLTLLKAEKISILTSNEKEGYIVTKPHPPKPKYNTLVWYQFFVRGNNIVLRGGYHHKLMPYEIKFGDRSFELAWEAMDTLAKMLGPVSYSRKTK